MCGEEDERQCTTNTKFYSGSELTLAPTSTPQVSLGNFTITPLDYSRLFCKLTTELVVLRAHNELGRFSQAHRLEPTPIVFSGSQSNPYTRWF